MFKRYFIGRLFGIPFYLETTFLLLLGIYALSGGFSTQALQRSMLFALSVVIMLVLHELGHAVTARAAGAHGISIVLHGMGGLTTHSPLRSLRQSLLVTVAGPLTGLLLGGALYGLLRVNPVPLPGPLDYFLGTLVYVCLLWSLFNLIPMQPLDGGHLLRDLLLLRLNRTRALELSLAISFFLAVGIGLGAVIFREIFVALICFFSGQHVWQQMGGAGPLRRFWQNLLPGRSRRW